MSELQSSFLVSKTRIAPRLMLTLKEIAARMDCHERTAKRWWKKLAVPPDLIGHGPHKWQESTAAKLLKKFFDFYKWSGTTPQITRAKFAGKYSDPNQTELPLFNQKFHASKNPPQNVGKSTIHPQFAKAKIIAAKART